MTLEAAQTFFGYCSLINAGILVFSSIKIVLIRKWASKIHGRMFNMSETEISRAYFQFLAQHKLAFIVFNLVPYLALSAMSG